MLSKKKVLIVEDDNLIVKLYTTRLNHEGFEVFSANDGETGLKMFLSEQPDLLLLDLMIPGISGADLLQKIREQDKKTPILVYTVLNSAKIIKDLKIKGVTEYFVKSDTHPRKLVEKIKTYLN